MAQEEKSEMLRVSISGLSLEKWNNLQGQLYDIIQDIVAKLSNGDGTCQDIANDINTIARHWEEVSDKEITPDTARLKAELAESFAKAKAHLQDAEHKKELTLGLQIDNLEKVLRVMSVIQGSFISFAQNKSEANLIIGPYPQGLVKKAEDDSMLNS